MVVIKNHPVSKLLGGWQTLQTERTIEVDIRCCVLPSTSSIMFEGHQSSHCTRACDMGSLLLRVIKSCGMDFDTSCEDDGGNCEVSRIQIYIY